MQLVTRLTKNGKKMCVTPSRLADGTLAACRNCWRCRSNYKNDWSGRCIAESEYSSQTLAVTLTYAGGYDNPSAVALVYDDFQRFMKRMRKKLGNVRYMVAGEYGTEKERSHWHSILFLKENKLNIVSDLSQRDEWGVFLERPNYQGKPNGDPLARIKWAPWSNHDMNGFAYFQQPDYEGISYVTKYIQKDTEQQGSERAFQMSKQPPLGHEYFQDLAHNYVENGLAPQTWEYSFPHILDRQGRVRKFWMSGTTRANFVQAFKENWELHYGDTPRPYSPMLEEFEDKAIEQEMQDAISDEKLLAAKTQWPKYQNPYNDVDEMTEHPLVKHYIEGKFDGDNYFGILVEDPITRLKSVTLYTEFGATWHGEGSQLRNVQRKGYVTITSQSRYDDQRDAHNVRIANWKDDHGLFPPQLSLPY
jgi:hypothetical protein